MNRITEIELAGRKYPLNFSTKAVKDFSARYGGLENITSAFSDRKADEALEELIWMLSVLIAQGVAYMRLVDGEDVQGITADELEVVLGLGDLGGLKDKLMDALTSGMSRTVEVQVDPKNGETTQGK